MISLSAPAKINWFLEITGRRPDGYHTLHTIFQTISLADRLRFSPAATLRVRCSDPSLPVDERNLVTRAAIRLQAALGETRGAHIDLQKNVPMGAGLGGGSADAAITLKGLLRLWRRRLDPSALARLAVSLGADVPFFLRGGKCRATGIGEKLTRLKPSAKTWLVIVWPGFGISTKDAYARVRLPFEKTMTLKGAPLFNRFESLVFPQHPELPALKQRLLNAGCEAALMSGSGSAVFGVVRSKATGEKILDDLRERYPHSWLAHTLQ